MKRMKRLIAVALAVGLLMSLPATANAASDETEATSRPTIEQVKERAQAAIDRRLDTLDTLTQRVTDSAHMTDAHKGVLLGEYATAEFGLAALGDEIAAATTGEELRELVPLIAKDFRIYLVVAPKSREVNASDRVGDVVERLDEAADTVAEAIRRGEEAGLDMSAAQRWLISARDDIAEARSTGVPVAGDVIGLQASDWEEPASSALQQGKRRLENAHIDIHKAKASLEKARDAIKDAIET
ncbi:MAG: hypothetical protein BMS9Abin17_0977 [Acidimicrobiia bacterium]|nr:MAG: hypothetical protein BMS9Abin17_0977 [Acidimicrobiia bacterium]